jgi:hypothetical protein
MHGVVETPQMIEIRKINNKNGLFIDGRLVRGAKLLSTPSETVFFIDAPDRTTSDCLAKHSILEYPPLGMIQLVPGEGWLRSVHYVYVSKGAEEGQWTIGYQLFSTGRVENQYPFIDYHVQMDRLAKARPLLGVTVTPPPESSEGEETCIVHFPASPESIIETEISRNYLLLLEFHQEVERSLKWSPFTENSLVAWFEFPEAIKVPCEQYLQYFVQFLRDLGVEANSELKQQAGHVLFSVTPVDKEDALESIRDALDIYLRLPSSPLNDFGTAGDAEIQRLAANILHLKGQLQLARAVLQANNATIQAQHFTIGQQQQLLSDQIVERSVVKVDPVSANTESLLGGRLSLGEYQGKGVAVNLAMLFRDLKKLFKRKGVKET